MRAGVACSDLYDVAVATAGRLGCADAFMGARPDQVSFVGHGLGLEMDEPPYLARTSRWVLKPGNVIAVEPKIVFPGVSVRWEWKTRGWCGRRRRSD